MASKRKMKPRTEKLIEGVKMNHVKDELVRKAYIVAFKASNRMSEPPMKLPKPGDLDLDDVVRNLVLWYRVSTPADSLCECTTCGGDSDSKLDACPFCGDSESEEEVEAEEEVEEEPAKPAKASKTTKATKASPAPKAEPVKAKKSKEQEPEPVKAPSKKQKKPSLEPKTKDASIVIATTEDGTEVIDKSALSVCQLDKYIQEINERKISASKDIWFIGKLITIIYQNKLWRLRLNEKLESAYSTWSQFCKAELGMSEAHALKHQQVYANFDSETVERLGFAKCLVELHLPAELKEKNRPEKKSHLSKDAEEVLKKEIPKTHPEALTVAMAPGIVDLKLNIRQKNGIRKASNVQAMSIDEDPWAVEILPNNVCVYYSVSRDHEGKLVLRVERKRSKRNEIFADVPEEEDEDTMEIPDDIEEEVDADVELEDEDEDEDELDDEETEEDE